MPKRGNNPKKHIQLVVANKEEFCKVATEIVTHIHEGIEDGKFPKTQTEWLAGATEHAGSWWSDWAQWLKGNAGKQIAAPKSYGKGKYKVIEAAPGRYVKAKA